MTDGDRVGKVRSALFDAPGSEVIEELHTAMTAQFAADGIDLYLADHQLVALQAVAPDPDDRRVIPVDGTPHGRAFAAQDPLCLEGDHGQRLALLPVTARGHRLGVLEVRLAGPLEATVIAELVEVARSLAFVLMLADGETDRYARARRRRRLTVPAEIQWDLLPAGTFTQGDFSLAAQLEPAYAVNGDTFDWSADGQRLTIAVTNGMGKGMQAALLTVLAVGALRNARRSGADLAEQAGQANDAIHARHGGTQFVETLLLEIDMRTGVGQAVDAGSPILLRVPGEAEQRQAEPFERIGLVQQLPLGMFPGTTYAVQRFDLHRGDRLIAVSDGLHGALSPAGDNFGGRGLERAIRASRRFSAAESVRALIRALLAHHDGAELQDDAVAVCVDRAHPSH